MDEENTPPANDLEKANQKMQEFSNLIHKNKYDPQVLSQIYKIMNYQTPSLNQKHQQNLLSPQEVAEYLKAKPNNQNQNQQQQDNDLYDNLRYYDEDKIKEIVLKQKFLISKGYFDPKKYFPCVQLNNLDDKSQDAKIRQMIDGGFKY
ncbi:hypothetical protein PPERSA_11106 [Pseudocohnilembus persalinus]|uniref:Uncharacterized protein n=1 Tax=Pseudocohnilembus persalinus TaxID=266149 RepID=A0A0V0R054_PSEPJ|nr:hypothetical protein PPERSA_11106 [Pseudocohnilembus persalinus]|eukprot:KRX07557.1 hypothetical protein PPERSA_11106 [Pseudocohnilembus persalinus]